MLAETFSIRTFFLVAALMEWRILNKKEARETALFYALYLGDLPMASGLG